MWTSPVSTDLWSPVASSVLAIDRHREKTQVNKNVYKGMPTPWGAAQRAIVLAAGIGIVSTEAHGGIKLSHERNDIVPEYMRTDNGWYEEDCEIAVPLLIFKDEMLDWDWPDSLRKSITCFDPAKHLADWFPDEYERYRRQFADGY
jgi:hypothetical protein